MWSENNASLQFDELNAVEDYTFELTEKFFIVAMLNQSTSNVTLNGTVLYDEHVARYPSSAFIFYSHNGFSSLTKVIMVWYFLIVAIQGPNDVDFHVGEIQILNDTVLIFNESNQVTFLS